MSRLAWMVAGLVALLSGGCAVYGSAETTTFSSDGETARITAESWEGSVACGPGIGQSPCTAASIHRQVR